MIANTFITPWGASIKTTYRPGTIDENTLLSCLMEDEYCIGKLPEGGTAIDLGTYIGGATLALCSRGYRVIGVEMLPENQDMCRFNVNKNKFSSLLYPAAVSPQDRQHVTAWYENRQGSTNNGSLLERKENGRSIEVPTISLPTIFDENEIDHCDFLKVDIEGAEWRVFQSLPKKYLDRIDRIAIELHDYGRKTSTSAFLPFLREKFDDVSSTYFPKWCHDGEFVHGYYIRKGV